MEIADGGVRVSTGDAICRKAQVHLELAQSVFGVRAKNAILVAARKAKRAKSPLKIEHVVTVEIRHTKEQRAITQRERRVDQSRPNALVDFVGLGQRLLLAEGANCLCGFLAECAIDMGAVKQADTSQTMLDVFDCGPFVTLFNRIHACHDRPCGHTHRSKDHPYIELAERFFRFAAPGKIDSALPS